LLKKSSSLIFPERTSKQLANLSRAAPTPVRESAKYRVQCFNNPAAVNAFVMTAPTSIEFGRGPRQPPASTGRSGAGDLDFAPKSEGSGDRVLSVAVLMVPVRPKNVAM